MKRFIFLSVIALLFSFGTPPLQAQVQKPIATLKAALVNVDTTTATVTAEDGVKSFIAVLTRNSGTAAGKVYLKAKNDGTDYVFLDSLTLSNQVTNFKTFDPGKLIYSTYQLQFVVSGNPGNTTPKAYYLKRTN